MEDCKRCGASLPEGANFCPTCGRAVVAKHSAKKRGNGQGCVYQLPSGKYKAEVTVGYYLDENGKRHRQYRSGVFDRKKDALAAIPDLAKKTQKVKRQLTFKELYDAWFPTHRAGKSTLDCYSAAIKHFRDVWALRVSDIDVDDLQECLDACPAGKRTRENMRAVVGLMYKYGIPRHMVPENLNLAPFLIVSGDGAAHRESFTDTQIESIKAASGVAPYAAYIYCMIYTGFRPSEFLALTHDAYDPVRGTLTGGSKTEAGRGRVVTISPKIKKLIEAQYARHTAFLFGDLSGRQLDLKFFTEKCFYPALEKAGVDNPIVEVAGGVQRHKYTPHTCRHTFSTLMKRVQGAEKDKLELIGHASGEMLRYYQDVAVEDLRKITDAL